VKRLPNGEHPGWLWAAFLLACFVFVLHGSWSRSESFAIPSLGGASGSVNIGGQKGGQRTQ
jgi:hypothetical protein